MRQELDGPQGERLVPPLWTDTLKQQEQERRRALSRQEVGPHISHSQSQGDFPAQKGPLEIKRERASHFSK